MRTACALARFHNARDPGVRLWWRSRGTELSALRSGARWRKRLQHTAAGRFVRCLTVTAAQKLNRSWSNT